MSTHPTGVSWETGLIAEAREISDLSATVNRLTTELVYDERALEDIEMDALLPEMLKGKEGAFNGSNEGVRALQQREFLNSQSAYTSRRECIDTTRDDLSLARMRLANALRLFGVSKLLLRLTIATLAESGIEAAPLSVGPLEGGEEGDDLPF